MRNWFLLLVVIVIGVLFCAGVAGAVLWRSADMPTRAMEPTLHQGDRMAILPLFGQSLTRGEIVAFHPPNDEGVTAVSRLVGVPGDRLRVVSGHLEVNGKEVYEPYFKASSEGTGADYPANTDALVEDEGVQRLQHAVYGEWVAGGVLTLPEDYYFVLSDNRGVLQDSRKFGPVQRALIIARPVFVFSTEAAGSSRRLIHSDNLDVN